MVAGLAPAQRGGTAFTTAISTGLPKPLSSLWPANSASSPSSRRGLTKERLFSPRLALSNVESVAPSRTYYQEGDGGRPNRMVAKLYERDGWPPPAASVFAGFQGPKGHGNNVAQLEAQSSQTRATASKWREAAKMIVQNRNPSNKVVDGIGLHQQNIDSLKEELKQVGDITTTITRIIRESDVLDIREPKPLSREEEGQSSPIFGGEVTENSVRQHLRTEIVPIIAAEIGLKILHKGMTLRTCIAPIPRLKLIRTKALNGRGQKQEAWVEWLHNELIDKFVRLKKASVKLSSGLLLTFAKDILEKSEHPNFARNALAKDGMKLMLKMTPC